jgi:3-methyladenine DNA glycosylase/8-oxoguanine DNA glycosylase
VLEEIVLTPSTTPDAVEHVPVAGPFDLGATLAPLHRGSGDPTHAIEGRAIWRATRTPEGPATLRLEHGSRGVDVVAWGPGSSWAIARARGLLGIHDDPGALRPRHALVRDLRLRFAGIRLGRTDAVLEALVPAILEQKVTGDQARRGYRGLLRTFGEPAPGPEAPSGRRLIVPPSAAALARLPYFAFHPFGIERRRADSIRRAAASSPALEAAVGLPLAEAYARLVAIPGVGPWTAAEVAARALGDPDAVSLGDYHLPHLVAWALAGEPRGTDERMLELLEPYRGQRGRVIRLLEASGIRPPRRGPRMAPRRIESD